MKWQNDYRRRFIVQGIKECRNVYFCKGGIRTRCKIVRFIPQFENNRSRRTVGIADLICSRTEMVFQINCIAGGNSGKITRTYIYLCSAVNFFQPIFYGTLAAGKFDLYFRIIFILKGKTAACKIRRKIEVCIFVGRNIQIIAYKRFLCTAYVRHKRNLLYGDRLVFYDYIDTSSIRVAAFVGYRVIQFPLSV